jgi:hypothetical protein
MVNREFLRQVLFFMKRSPSRGLRSGVARLEWDTPTVDRSSQATQTLTESTFCKVRFVKYVDHSQGFEEIEIIMLKKIAVVGIAAVLAGSTLPAVAQTAKTPVVDAETITGARTGSLPTPPVISSGFTLPMKIMVVKDASITTNTPITDKATSVAAWGEAIRACLKDKPLMVRDAKGTMVPFVVNGSEGGIKLNANDKSVCPG